MPDSQSLALLSGALTCFAQIAVAFGLVQILSRLMVSARARMWLWSVFLLGSLGRWLAFLVAPVEVSPGPLRGLEWSYRLERIPADFKIWEQRSLRFYVSMAALSLLIWGYRRLQLRALLRVGQAPSPELALLFRRLAKKMKVESCRIVLIPKLRSPSMAGWLRPCVFLPSDLVPQLEPSELVDVLLHELIHVRRRDYVWDQLASLTCGVVFFHPAVWLARRRLRRERELACDQTMGGQLACRRLRYAECLMRLAKWWFLSDRYSVQGIGASSTASFLATRVRILLDEPRRRSDPQILVRAALAALIAVLGVYGVVASKFRFDQGDQTRLEARTLPHRPLARARRVHAAGAHSRQSAQEPAASELASNDSQLSNEAELEPFPVDNHEAQSSLEPATPTSGLGPAQSRRSAAANQPGFEGDSQPNWNEGSVEQNPLARPRGAGAAATAVRVAIGVALAIGDDDFVGGR